jgi:hypothetical protein
MRRGFGSSVMLFCAALLASGCDGDGGSQGAGRGGTGGANAGGGAAAGGSGAVGATSCAESPLFSARPYGTDGYDLIREVQVDEVSGDTYFSIMDDLFVLRAGATEPERLTVRPGNDVSDEFWLTDDSLLFPGGLANELEPAVLFETDRMGANPEVVIPLPEDNSLNWLYEAGKVLVVGDDVFWIARDRYTDDPSDLITEWQTTYAVRRTSLRSPAQPIDVYTSDRYLDSLIVAAGKAFVEEEVGDVQSFEFEQRIVEIATRAVDPLTATERYGGTVVAGNDDTLIVSNVDFDDPSAIGTYSVAPDGSGRERFTDNIFFGSITSRDGLWVYTETAALADPTRVMTYRRGEAPRMIGCIGARPSTTNHDLWVGEDEALVPIFRNQTSTILRFEL